MEDHTSDPVPPIPQDAEEKSYEKLQQKVDRLTLLLKKAKESLLDYGTRIKELEIEIKQKDEEELTYKSTITQLNQYKPPKPESITEVILRVQVYEDIYCFVNSTKGYFWLSAQQVSGKHVMPEILDSKNSKKVINDKINAAVQEWKEQCNILSDKLLVHEENTENLKKMVKELNKQNEELGKELKVFKDNSIESVIQQSFAIYEEITGILIGEGLDNDKVSLINKGLHAFCNGVTGDHCSKVKEHCANLLKYLLDLTKRLMHARIELKNQDFAWRSACDSLVKEKEELKGVTLKLKSEILQKTNEFNLRIENERKNAEKELERVKQVIKEKDDEISKSINGAYVKQVLIQYLMTSDLQVQDRMISVLSTVLGFSDEESQRLREKRAGKGVFSKFLYNSS